MDGDKVDRSGEIRALEEFCCKEASEASSNFLSGTLLGLTLLVTGGDAAIDNIIEHPIATGIGFCGATFLALALCYFPGRVYEKAREFSNKIATIKKDQAYDLLDECLSEYGIEPLR